MIKDTRYIIKRVIIGVLISLILSFIYACDVKAENQIISPSNLTLVRVYGSTNTTISEKNCNNNTCFWNNSGNATSFRWNSQSSLTYSNLDLVVFNMSLWQQTGSEEWPISEVAFGNSECFYIRNDNPLYDDGANAASTINISALCPIGDTVSLSSGSKTVNITLNNTGSEGNFFKLALSNITLTKDNKMVEMLNYLGTINTALSTLNNSMSVVKQDLTYLLQAQNNTSYWAEVNSGKLESIKTILQSQTSSIQNSISTASQNEINNATENTQQQIQSQEVCENISSKDNVTSNNYLRENGNIQTTTSNYGITRYIKIDKNTKIKVISEYQTNNPSLCFYNANKTLISCIRNDTLSIDDIISIPNNSSYVRFSINASQDKPQFEICKNGNQATNDSINDVNDTLKDDNVDDPTSSLSDMDSKIATNSVISDLLLLPVSLFQKVINSINGTCSTFNLGSLLGTNLSLPCINLSNILGSALYGVIDVLLCGIFVLSMRKRFVNIFENITSLKDRGNELE